MNELTESQQAAIAGGIVGAMLVTIFICAFVFLVLRIIANWKIFEKADEKGWKALIPIYSDYIAYKITGMVPWFWVLIAFGLVGGAILGTDQTFYQAMNDAEKLEKLDLGQHIPAVITEFVIALVSVIAGIVYAWRLTKAFKKSTGWFVGLLLLPNIFWLILAFGSSKYDKKFLKK